MSTIDGYWLPFGTPTAARGRSGVLRTVFCVPIAAMGRSDWLRSGTWGPDLMCQKLTSTTEVTVIAGLMCCILMLWK